MARTVGQAGAAPEEADLPDTDVPAAVLCMTCGKTDCVGCSPPERPRVAATPWEDADKPVWMRLWQTARLATVDGESFSAGYPTAA